MTVYGFRKVCDCENTILKYIILTNEGEEQLSFFKYDNIWASDDAIYIDNGDDEILYAKIRLTHEELNNAEIISIKPGSFTEIRVRL